MGYWGYFVGGRAGRPLGALAALADAAGLAERSTAPDGWQVWEYPSRDGAVGNMAELARETGAPALFGYVMDSASVVIEAAGPESGAWTACLGRTALAAQLAGGGSGDGSGGGAAGAPPPTEPEPESADPGPHPEPEGSGPVPEGSGPVLEDYFLGPRDAAERAAAWAAEAGRTVSAEALLDVLGAEPDPTASEPAEELFFRLLDRLTVVPL
jgi:hypothetical protein